MMERIKWHRFESTVSTNTYLTDLNGGDPDYDYEVAVASYQTSGRGQRGNSWESQPGRNLLFSILAHPCGIDVHRQFRVSQSIALAVADSLQHFLGPELGSGISIKWPNDIYWNDFKMGGILIEHIVMGSTIQHTVVGVGLDVNQTLFESDAPNPISMAMVAGRCFDLEIILADIVKRFALYLETADEAGWTLVNRRYHERLYRLDGYYDYMDSNGEFKARIDHVEPSGCLVLQTYGGQMRTYEFKQLKFVLQCQKE